MNQYGDSNWESQFRRSTIGKPSPVQFNDLQATILRCRGIDHERLTFRSDARDHRLTDIAGNVVREMLHSPVGSRG